MIYRAPVNPLVTVPLQKEGVQTDGLLAKPQTLQSGSGAPSLLPPERRSAHSPPLLSLPPPREGAAFPSGEDHPGIEDAQRIERSLELSHDRELARVGVTQDVAGLEP